MRFRHFWGATKRAQLVESLAVQKFNDQYLRVTPTRANYYSFRPLDITATYESWPSLTDLCRVPPMLGVLEKRKGALQSADRDELESRMQRYCDSKLPWSVFLAEQDGLTRDAAGFDAKKTRDKVASAGFDARGLRRILVRPMDHQWCYYSSIHPLWNRSRPALLAQCWEGNAFFVCRNKAVAAKEGVPFFFTKALGDEHAFHKDAYYIPLLLRDSALPATDTQGTLLKTNDAPAPNLSSPAWEYLASLGYPKPIGHAASRLIWMHVLAVAYSPAYRRENEHGIRTRWPRIPFPASKEQLESSADIGTRIAQLLDAENPVEHVTSGKLRDDLKSIAVISRLGGGGLDPRTLAATGRVGTSEHRRDRDAGKREACGAGLHSRRSCSDCGRGSGRRLGDATGPRPFGPANVRRLPERPCILERRPDQGLGLYDRRVSGDQEVAELPRARDPRTIADERRGTRGHQHRPPHRSHPAFGARTRCQLRGGEAVHVRVAISRRLRCRGSALKRLQADAPVGIGAAMAAVTGFRRRL